MHPIAGRVIWITGLPAAGKSTLAQSVLAELARRGEATLWLDSDDLRPVLTPEPTYSDGERDLFYRAIGHLAELGARGGATVVVSATASKRAYRDAVRRAVPSFMEIWLSADPEILRGRDPKGLYGRAAAGELLNLPGQGSAYEPPERPELVLDSGTLGERELLGAVFALIDGKPAQAE